MSSTTRSGVAKAAALITMGGLASRILGLVREQLAASHFGAGDRVAAFQIADNVQTLLFDLVISGMLQAALVPILVSFAAWDQRQELRRISGTIVTATVLLVGSATVAGWFFTNRLVRVMTTLGSGDQKRSPATVELTQELVRIVLPAVLFLALGSVFSAVLYSVGKPSGAATALAAENLAVVVAILVLSDRYGIKSMAYGVSGRRGARGRRSDSLALAAARVTETEFSLHRSGSPPHWPPVPAGFPRAHRQYCAGRH